MYSTVKRFFSTERFSFSHVRLSQWSVPLALAILTVLGFGLLLPWLGFYWDDWPSIWFNHIQGASIFKAVFASDRPLLGRLFMLTMPWLGENILAWQIFGLLNRWLTALIFWWMLRLVWPHRPRQVTWMALLFLIYPGFSQQWISVTYSHVFLTYAVFFLSFCLMLWAARGTKWAWLFMALAVLMAALVMFTHEYFFGLELLRPIFLWVILAEDGKNGSIRNRRQVVRKVLINWLPYLAITLVFVIWRLFIHEFPRAEMSLLTELKSNPLLAFMVTAKTVLIDVITTGLLAWGRAFQVFVSVDLHSRIDILTLVLIVLTAVGTWFYLTVLGDRPQKDASLAPAYIGERTERNWALQVSGIGLFALLVAGWPAWVTALPIKLEFPWDRFTLSMMPGASLLIVGLLGILFKNDTPKIALLAIIIGVAVGFHFQTANIYKKEWETQKDFFWQWVWRIPGLTPGTTLFTEHLPFQFYTDNSLTAPFNWVYAPENTTLELSYLIYDNQVRHEEFEGFKMGVAINRDYRAARFSGNTDQMLVYFYNPPACLRILEPAIDSKIHKYPITLYEAMYLSDIKWIQLDPQKPALPPVGIFGPEPAHDWCYYFAKASVAQQVRDWEQVIAVGEQARKDGYSPADPVEYFPFIEANASLGAWDKAQTITGAVLQERPKLVPSLCALWDKIAKGKPGAAPVSMSVVADVRQSLGCQNP